MARLHHLALGTQDVGKLAHFYCTALELTELARHDDEAGELRSVWLDLGGSVLMIEHTQESPRRVEGIGAGPFLIAFAVSAEERTRFEQRLTDAGSSIESRSNWTSYTRDPDGNRIAISCYALPLVNA